MKNSKQNLILIILLIIFIITTIALGGYIIYDKVSNNNTNKEEIQKPSTNINELFQNYFDVRGAFAGGPESILYNMFDYNHINSESYIDNFVESNIKSSTFKDKLFSIVSEKHFNELQTYFCEERFGYTCFVFKENVHYFLGGASGANFKVKKVEQLKNNEYNVTVGFIDRDGSISKESIYRLTLTTYNGNFVVDSYHE